MKIACEACGAKYTIADDKIRGRKVKIRCKGCGTPIVVDGQQAGSPNISDAETDADAALEPVEAAVIWSVNLSDTDSRTMSTDEIVQAYAAGIVTADAFIWKDGLADWVPLLESELAPLLASTGLGGAPGGALPVTKSTPFASAPSAGAGGALTGRGGMPSFSAPNQGAQSSRPAATRASQPDNTQDLFGAIHTAGAEDEIATSAPIVPQAGSAAYDDGKLTGARNENSVLFSLDALKAGFSPSQSPNASKSAPKVPSKSAPGASRPEQQSNPDDPFGMGASNGLMGIGGSSGILFGADNQALLTAPAPPPPPTPAQVAAGAMPAPAPANNKLVYIVGGVGGVVIIGLLLALILGKKHDAAPSADSGGAPSASTVHGSSPEKPATDEAKPAEPEKPSEAASASAAPSASAAASAKPADKPALGGQTTPKKPKEEAPAPAADAPPFSKASAISALGAAASAAGSCKKPGGPTGAGKATVTFAPSGRVTTATIAGGSYAGTAVGGCVASVFRRAHLPAFSGSSVTVSKSFQIN